VGGDAMRLKKAVIRHYRSIRELEIPFGNLTRIIGANGSGKSTILKALQLFYAPGVPQLTRDDFHGRDESQDIEIALTFTDFSDAEREMFGGRITGDGEMTVTRVFSAGGGKANGKYHGVTLRNAAFAEARQADGLRAK